MTAVGFITVLHTQALDSLLFRLINGVWTNSLLDLVMPLLSLVGNWGMVWLVLLGGIALFGGAVERWAALAGLIALAAGAVISEVLKDLTMESRPFVSLPDVRLLVDPPDWYAFSSGHATYAFSASFGAVLAARWLLGRVPLWGGGLLALAAAISYSRIYVGVHYPSDLLSGEVLGAFVGCITAPLTIHFHQ